MRSQQSPRSEPPTPAGERAPAALAVGVGILLCTISLAGGSLGGAPAPFPYVWADVAIVHLVCALPLALAVAAVIRRRMSAVRSIALAFLFLCIALLSMSNPIRASLMATGISVPVLGLVLRTASALGVVVAVVLASAVVIGRPRFDARRDSRRKLIALTTVGTFVLLLPPYTYVGARCRNDLARLGEFLEQSRLGEGRALATRLVEFDPAREWDGHPLAKVAADLERIVAELQSQVAVSLAPGVTAGRRLERARQLAMLGRTAEAIDVLQPLRRTPADPQVETLAGTIHEAEGQWGEGLESYRKAQAAWESRPPGPERSAGLLRATTGMAYCQRKAGRYADAEASYRQVLTLSPTADSHFLLAQFYEDAQDAGNARSHARRAIELAPDRYRRDGERLIRKLSVYQFGCLGVYLAGSDVQAGTEARPSAGGS
jgi:Flp pilus assembly protein TadD